jgi:hypothetical protein
MREQTRNVDSYIYTFSEYKFELKASDEGSGMGELRTTQLYLLFAQSPNTKSLVLQPRTNRIVNSTR